MNTLAGKISVDFRSNEPLYLQIARQIEQAVIQGDLQLGAQLPTVREMATELRINFNTVSRAYRVLDEAGIISTQRGRGTYIWDQPSEEAMNMIRMKSLEELARNFRDEIFRLGYNLDDAIEALKTIPPSGAEAAPEGSNDETKI